MGGATVGVAVIVSVYLDEVSPIISKTLLSYTAHPRNIYSVSEKIPPFSFLTFFPNGWEFLINFLHTYYTFQSILDYKIVG